MGWGSFDDQMPLHAKVLALSDGAFRLWQNIIHHCNRSKTGGVIPKALVPACDHRRGWTQKQIDGFLAELVATQPGYSDPLLIDEGAVYRVHDYEDHQQYSLRQAERREAERARKAASRAKSRHVSAGQSAGQSAGHGGGQAPDMSTGHSDECPTGTVRSASSRASDRDPDPQPKKSVSHSLARESSAGVRSERIREGFLRRFESACPGISPDPTCYPMAGGPWLDIARGTTDANVDALLDAYFADDFCRSGYRPNALRSERVRLLTEGPKVSGKVRPPSTVATSQTTTSPLEAAWLKAKEEAHEALKRGLDPEILYRLDQAEEAALKALQASRGRAA